MDLAVEASRPGTGTGLLRRTVAVLLAVLSVGAGLPVAGIDAGSRSTVTSSSLLQEEVSATAAEVAAPTRRTIAGRRRWHLRRRMARLLGGAEAVGRWPRALVGQMVWGVDPIVPRQRRGPPRLTV